MDVKTRNALFLSGKFDTKGLFPQLEEIKNHPFQFHAEFGLDSLPDQPGLILIRGARQFGKSTWLEQKIYQTLKEKGPGSALYFNGDDIYTIDDLMSEIVRHLATLPKSVLVPRIFIDEITSILHWEKALKRLYDSGETRRSLIITTGSKAIDLRRGTERLPGRKGRLERTNFLFTPVSYRQFKEKCSKVFSQEDLLYAYLLTGGSPLAINELAKTGKVPEYVIELTRDWIYGECAAQGRSRNLINWVIHALSVRGGAPVPLTKLAEESGSANNTVVRGYVELLADLLCLSIAMPVEGTSGRPVPRKAYKYHWINLLAAISFHPSKPRTVEDIKQFSGEELGKWWEWLVAQELWRRDAVSGKDSPEFQGYWQSKDHEVDFLINSSHLIEVKKGTAHPLEFAWFPKVFPKSHLTVIATNAFETSFAKSLSLEEFLLSSP